MAIEIGIVNAGTAAQHISRFADILATASARSGIGLLQCVDRFPVLIPSTPEARAEGMHDIVAVKLSEQWHLFSAS